MRRCQETGAATGQEGSRRHGRLIESTVQQSTARMLSSIASTQPHAAFAAFTHGLSSKWTYNEAAINHLNSSLPPSIKRAITITVNFLRKKRKRYRKELIRIVECYYKNKDGSSQEEPGDGAATGQERGAATGFCPWDASQLEEAPSRPRLVALLVVLIFHFYIKSFLFLVLSFSINLNFSLRKINCLHQLLYLTKILRRQNNLYNCENNWQAKFLRRQWQAAVLLVVFSLPYSTRYAYCCYHDQYITSYPCTADVTLLPTEQQVCKDGTKVVFTCSTSDPVLAWNINNRLYLFPDPNTGNPECPECIEC